MQVGGGKLNSYSAFSANLRVQGLQPGGSEYEIQFQVYRRPCGSLARLDWADKKTNWPHLKDLDLPQAAQRPVEGILGTSEPWLLAALEPSVTGGRHEPIATKTRLGWLVGGPVHPTKLTHASINVSFMGPIRHVDSYDETKRQLERFWEPAANLKEARNFNSRRNSADIEKAKHTFEQTITRLPNGQFQVGLLWSDSEPNLSPNHDAALRMFHRLERQLDHDEVMRENFNKTIIEWKNTSIAQYVESREEIKYFLPTFMVIRTDKATTAYRVVVDGARKFAGTCINDRLLAGPSLKYHIFDVLCRMRLGNYAVTCDVQTMYLKVKVAPNDQAYLGLFFREESHRPIEILKLTSHPFGLKSSPYVAMRTVQRYAEHNRQRFPLAAKAVDGHVIVDDFLVSGDDWESLKNTLKELESMLQEIGMGIHKIAASDIRILEGIEPSKIAKTVELGDQETWESRNNLPSVKTLGLVWESCSDSLAISFSPRHEHEELTLRKVVSDGGRLFDPLGLTLPVAMSGRILQQACWSISSGWDSVLDDRMQQRWKKWLHNTKKLATFQIPRAMKRIGKPFAKQRLIVFVDASSEAQAVATYVQTLYTDGTLGALLLAAKGKVSALKKQESIPRLGMLSGSNGSRIRNENLSSNPSANRGFRVLHGFNHHIVVDQVHQATQGVRS